MTNPIFQTIKEKKQKNYGKFVISPLAQGYGQTLGNSLRRVLLMSLSGAAITSVKIAGVKHQFSTLKGMKEDVVEFTLNLKKVRVVYDKKEPLKATIAVKGSGEVKAKDIVIKGSAQIANPELVLATLNKGAELKADLVIESGSGYSIASDREVEKRVGLIHLDSSFSPVERVNYSVSETRVGRVTNFDKLTLEIWTDGSQEPYDALVSAANILVSYFQQIVSPKKAKKAKTQNDESLGSVGKLSVEEIGLPTRVANALIKSGNETVDKLVDLKRVDMVKIRNLGEKSIKIISAALGEKGVKFPNN